MIRTKEGAAFPVLTPQPHPTLQGLSFFRVFELDDDHKSRQRFASTRICTTEQQKI